MTITETAITHDLYQYLVSHSQREPALLAELREKTLEIPGGKMMSSPEQVQFIAMLIKLMNAHYVIEVGTFTGYATLAMAEALGPEGKIITCDISSEAPQLGQSYWQRAKVAEKIELVVSPALTTLDELIIRGDSNKVDLAYIDADKRNNQNYYEKLMTLLRPGGLIIIDNVLWYGRVLEQGSPGLDKTTESIQQFNDYVAKDERVEASIVPLGDGMTLVRKLSSASHT